MLTCLPKGICSSDFRVPEAGNARVAILDRRSKEGLIQLDGAEYIVNKQPHVISGWNLSRAGKLTATGANPGIIAGNYELKSEHGTWKVVAGFSGRSFRILSGETEVGAITPVHAFTRRAKIECSDTVPLLEQLFAFYLVLADWQSASAD